MRPSFKKLSTEKWRLPQNEHNSDTIPTHKYGKILITKEAAERGEVD
jgi:hypothetical protein